MLEFIFKIWYMIAVLPYIILTEGTIRFSDFLKKKNIYSHWDFLHSVVVVLIVLFIVFWIKGYRF